MKTFTWARGIAWLAVLGALGCSDPMVAPDPPGTTKTPAELTILRLPANAPPLFNDSVSFLARMDRDAEGIIYFQNQSGQRGEKFARLKIKQRSLLARPDGSAFGPNDSILIVMKVTDPRQLLVEMAPAGLKFATAAPAELQLEYEETKGDLDHDGDDDGEDGRIEQLLAIWRQESASDPFVKLGTVKIEGARELKASLLGFSRFAIAY